MIVEYIRYQVSPEQADGLVEAYRGAARPLLASPHCQGYDVARSVEDAGSVVVRIHWDSAQGHLEGFRRSPEFREFFPLVRPYVDAIAEMRHYELAVGRPLTLGSSSGAGAGSAEASGGR